LRDWAYVLNKIAACLSSNARKHPSRIDQNQTLEKIHGAVSA
jgi:hypothetical protein